MLLATLPGGLPHGSRHPLALCVPEAFPLTALFPRAQFLGRGDFALQRASGSAGWGTFDPHLAVRCYSVSLVEAKRPHNILRRPGWPPPQGLSIKTSTVPRVRSLGSLGKWETASGSAAICRQSPNLHLQLGPLSPLPMLPLQRPGQATVTHTQAHSAAFPQGRPPGWCPCSASYSDRNPNAVLHTAGLDSFWVMSLTPTPPCHQLPLPSERRHDTFPGQFQSPPI